VILAGETAVEESLAVDEFGQNVIRRTEKVWRPDLSPLKQFRMIAHLEMTMK
jgi:hypothetical protein